MIEGGEWLIFAIFVAAFLVSVYLIVSVQGDVRLKLEHGENTDEQAAEMFIALIRNARKSIVIHDDGDDSTKSLYNNDEVIDAIAQQIGKYPNLQVKCWFNDHENIKFRSLAEGALSDNFKIWYSNGERPNNDIHYKIIDGGRLVHLSRSTHGAGESEYFLRRAETPFAIGTRKRISREYLAHFESGIAHASSRSAIVSA